MVGDLAAYNDALRAANEYIATFNFVENATTDEASRAASKKNNAAAQARVEIKLTSKGSGQRRFGLVTFPVIFAKEPHFTTGSAVIRNPQPKIWHDPIGSAGVYAWKSDSRGFFLGAFMWVRVDVYPVDETFPGLPPETMTTQHYLTFSAEAIKQVSTGAQVKTATASLATRTVGLV